MAPNPADPPPPHTGPPAVSLIVGFGVIILGATVVHVVFDVLVRGSRRSCRRRFRIAFG